MLCYLQFLIYKVSVLLFSFFLCICTFYDELYFTYETHKSEYDYIIVGSGTAGSLIAYKLATETNHSFIILEAGGYGNSFLNIPIIGPLLQGSQYDWQHETVPQARACLAMKNQQCQWPRGKIVGGSARLNNMIHIRGNITQYVQWFKGKYTEHDINRHFDKIEYNILPVNQMNYHSELTTAVLEAAEELGYFGEFIKSPLNQRKGSRWTTFHTLETIKHNLITNALVEKVIIFNNKAKGVMYEKFGKKYEIGARKGVILSAGTVDSPKILMLSGIGPKDILNQLNIKVLQSLPVGENLLDHVTTGLDLVLLNKTLSINPNNMFNIFNIAYYFINGTGPLTSPGSEVSAFLSTNNKHIDLQLMILPVGLTSDRGSHLKNIIGIKHNIWKEYFTKFLDKQAVSFLPIVLHPKSKGQIKLKSKNIHDKPYIDPKYFSYHDDLEIIIKGIRIVEKIVNTKSMRKLGAEMNPNIFPGCENYNFSSDYYWECYIRHMTLTSFHPVGTNALGSVVDLNFQVKGIDKLYVVDASVLPELSSGNINAVIALMGDIFFESQIISKKHNYYCDILDVFLVHNKKLIT